MSTPAGRLIIKNMLEGGYEYCGGQPWWEGDHHSDGQKRHHNYYQTKKQWKNLPFIPTRHPRCECNAKIWWQCYIMKPGDGPTDEMTIVGNCCILLFCDGQLRTCSICGASHQTRNWDLCKECKKPVDTAEKSVIRIAKQVKKAMNKLLLLPELDSYINMHNIIRDNMLAKLKSNMSWYQNGWLNRKINRGFEFYQAEPIYLNVPYPQRQIAKTQYGCRWNKDLKKWYCYEEGIDPIRYDHLEWCFNSFKHIHRLRIPYVV